MKSWKRIAITDHAKIMANVSMRMLQDPQWTKDGGAFIPHPSSYLNQQRWNDEMLPASGASKAPPKKPFIPQPHRGIFTQEDLDMLNASYG